MSELRRCFGYSILLPVPTNVCHLVSRRELNLDGLCCGQAQPIWGVQKSFFEYIQARVVTIGRLSLAYAGRVLLEGSGITDVLGSIR